MYECKSSDLHRIYAFDGRNVARSFPVWAESHCAYEFIGLLLRLMQLFSLEQNNKIGTLHRKTDNLINGNRKRRLVTLSQLQIGVGFTTRRRIYAGCHAIIRIYKYQNKLPSERKLAIDKYIK